MYVCVFSFCFCHDPLQESVFQAASFAVLQLAQPLWKATAEALHIQVAVDLFAGPFQACAKLLRSFEPALTRHAFAQAVPDPGHCSFMKKPILKVARLLACVVTH